MMPDYKKMYFLLFNELTDAIEKLKEAQKRCEEYYIFCESEEDEEEKQ